MAVAAGGAGASALIMALNSAKTVKSTKAMLDNTKELNKAQENGALNSFNQLLQGLQNSGPIQSAFQVLFAQIQVGTVGDTVALMNQMLVLFASEGGQRSIELLIELINLLIRTGGRFVEIIDALANPEELATTLREETQSYSTTPIDYHDPSFVDQVYRPGVQEF